MDTGSASTPWDTRGSRSAPRAQSGTGNHETAATPWLPVMVERIVRGFQPLQIILFGSRARGEARWDSDIDLLVVLLSVTDKRRTAIEIGSMLSDLPVAKDIIVTTPEEIARYGNMVGRVLRPALREGKVVYEHR